MGDGPRGERGKSGAVMGREMTNGLKFVVVTYGTEGDARPLSALCRALVDAGHKARLLADAATLGTAESLGISTVVLAGDIRGTLRSTGTISHVIKQGSNFNRMVNALAGIANANADAWLRAIVDAGEGCDAIIVSGLAAFAGFSAAEHLGVKAIGTGLIPITQTMAFPSPFLSPKWVPRSLNRTSHRLVNGLLWRAFRRATNAARANVCGLAPRQAGWNGYPMLYGISPSLLPLPGDWPDNAQVCGQWVPPSTGWAPPQTLRDFLAAGDAPLYIGFGSMVGFDQHRPLKEIVAAVAGRRALFYPGWSGVDTASLPANFFVVGDTPHSWLFPKTSLVVHHGGSGTSHSAARAGVPSVVVPFAGDQFFWADRLKQAGVATAAVNGRDLRAQALTSAIEFAEADPVRARARALGERMRAEDGLARATLAIEKIMAR
jgi:sterol 3beta-glucosyltransferase